MGKISNTNVRKLTFILIDLFIIFISYILAFNIRFENIEKGNWSAFMSLSPWILLIALFFIIMYELDSVDRKNRWDIIRNILVATSLMMLLTMAASFLFREFALPRSVILIAFLIGNILLVLSKVLTFSIVCQKFKKVLFIGTADEQKKIEYQMNLQFGNRTKIEHVDVHADTDEVYCRISKVDYVVIGANTTNEHKSKIIYEAIKNGKVVYLIPDFYDLLLSQSVITTIDDTMVLGVKPFGLTLSQKILKRVYDICISIFALIILSPLFIIIIIIMKIKEPKGSVFYKQARLGKDNKEFIIYKFRSMVEGAEKLTGPVLAGQNDPRITNFGHFIRKTRIDELPQFLNVLKGDMSIVGPRPEREFFIKQFEEQHSSYIYRNTVQPGITGYAQIMGKYTTTVEDKLRFDLFYIRNYSFLLDIIIQFRTVIVMLDKTKSEGGE